MKRFLKLYGHSLLFLAVTLVGLFASFYFSSLDALSFATGFCCAFSLAYLPSWCEEVSGDD